jgi:hypothetical protein
MPPAVAAMVVTPVPVVIAMSGVDADADRRGGVVIRLRAIGRRHCDAASQSEHGDRSYDQAFHARSSRVLVILLL